MSRAPRRVLCVGEPLIALVPESGTSLDAADNLQVVAGGAELNVAVHLARLGIAVRFAGLVGADPWGRRLRVELAEEGVDVSPLGTHPSRPTGFYIKEIEAEGTAMRYYRKGSAASQFERVPVRVHEGVDHVHLTGITPALSAACARLVRRELALPGGRTTSFDVNYRAILWSADRAAPVLKELAEMATIAFVGLDEAHQLWGCRDAKEVRDLLPGPEELVVKDGPREAAAFASGEAASVAALPVQVVDAVGAGDAFAAAYLAARWRGRSLSEALHDGHALAATVIRSSSDHGSAGDSSMTAAHLLLEGETA